MNPTEELQQILVNRLQLPNPKFQEAQSSGRSVYGLQPMLYNFSVLPDGSLLVPRGCRKSVLSLTDDLGINYTVLDERTLFPHITLDSSKIKYRPYQFDSVLNLFSKHQEAILVAPAGSGKTVMGLSLVPLSGQPTLWLTHTGALAKQAKDRAKFFIPDVGKIGNIGGGKWDIGDVLTIGMIQTLVRNPEKLIKMMNKFGMVILDEAHHCPASTFMQVIGLLNPYYLYGLTATPYRRDRLEKLMFQTIGEERVTISPAVVEAHGGIIIPTIKYKGISSANVMGNNIQPILKKYIVDNVARHRLIAGDVLAEAVKGNFCIVVSDRREHCESLHELIQAAWPKSSIATGKYSRKYVDEQVRKYNEGEITVLTTTFALLGEGFDVPFLNRAFIAFPFRAENKAEQLIGRVQRSFPGKKDAVVYDYVDVNIGVLANQFYNKNRDCRYSAYVRLGANVEPA